jgi:hypothetical protein
MMKFTSVDDLAAREGGGGVVLFPTASRVIGRWAGLRWFFGGLFQVSTFEPDAALLSPESLIIFLKNSFGAVQRFIH